jgi:hypothetical protein
MDFPARVSGIGEGRHVAENVVALRVMGTMSESLKLNGKLKPRMNGHGR